MVIVYQPKIPLVKVQEFLTKRFETVCVPEERGTPDSYVLEKAKQSIIDWNGNGSHSKESASTATDKKDGVAAASVDSVPTVPDDEMDHPKGDGSKVILFTILMVLLMELPGSKDSPLRDRDHQDDPMIDVFVGRIEEQLDTVLSCVHVPSVEEVRRRPSSHQMGEWWTRASQRVTRSLAQKIHRYFHLAGVGVDKICYGAVLSLVAIELQEIELVNIGTELVDVKRRSDGTYLLFDEATTRRLLGIRKGAPLGFDYHKDVPSYQGIHVLVQKCCEQGAAKDVFTMEGSLVYNHESSNEQQPLERTDYLGGKDMFASVYKQADDAVIKIPMVDVAQSTMKNEKKFLAMMEHDAIPKVDGWVTVNFQVDLARDKVKKMLKGLQGEATAVRCMGSMATLPGLRLVGIIGKPVSEFKKDMDILTRVLEGVQAALHYANCEKNIIHLNIRPSHIIVDDKKRVQLIGWGSASTTSDTLDHFRGSPAFAHDELLLERPDKWNPKRAYDLASFAYSMAAILYHITEQPPWCSGYYRAAWNDPSYLNRRREQATRLITNSDLSEQIKEELLAAM